MEPHVSTIWGSRYFLLVWEVITLTKTYHNAKKDILSLKKRDIIIDVISSDSMQN